MTLKEHIDDIRDNLEKGLFTSEADVCDNIVRRLLHEGLGWPRWKPTVVIREYGVEGTRVDFALCDPPSKPRVFIEVKKVGNIEGAEEQLFGSDSHVRVPIAVLTDGREWRFFHPTGEGTWQERKVCELDFIAGDSAENAERLNRYLNYESIRTEKAIEAIKADYEEVVRQRQVATRLPEAWGKLVEEADEFLLHAVAEKTESLCGHRPTDEQVLDFLKSLDRKNEPDNGKKPPIGPLSRNPGLFVTMPNGEQINHKVSATTFVEVIEKLGIERVKNLNKEDIIPLISTDKHERYIQRQSGRYYVMTNNNTQKKKAILEEIAFELGVNLTVEIVSEP